MRELNGTTHQWNLIFADSGSAANDAGDGLDVIAVQVRYLDFSTAAVAGTKTEISSTSHTAR